LSNYDTAERFTEPSGSQLAGTMSVDRPSTPYQRYMAAQGIPVVEGPGVHDVRELKLGAWDRVGGNGAFIALDNTLDLLGMHVIEIPPGGELNPQRHLFEEKYWVVEGEGTTEIWQSDESRRQRFEWHEGSLFAIPINTSFRLVNARSTRALLLAGNTAPPVLNIFDNTDFVFANPFAFRERYDESGDYYLPSTETYATPALGRAMWRTNIIPDIVRCELPLDNQRSPGYRRIEPHMARGNFWCFIGEHVPGRYSKAHAHASGAVLICVKGQGYTFNWPSQLGTTPWRDGKADQVERVEYVAGGMVAAAPGGGNWYHQHFSASAEPLRFLVFYGGLPDSHYAEYGGRNSTNVWTNADIEQGGRSISYRTEDPFIREEYQRVLAAEGVQMQMAAELYR
jgi:quercetin dioxygenase-like cupin family protein